MEGEEEKNESVPKYGIEKLIMSLEVYLFHLAFFTSKTTFLTSLTSSAQEQAIEISQAPWDFPEYHSQVLDFVKKEYENEKWWPRAYLDLTKTLYKNVYEELKWTTSLSTSGYSGKQKLDWINFIIWFNHLIIT